MAKTIARSSARRRADPIIAVWTEFRRVAAACDREVALRDEAEALARKAGYEINQPFTYVGRTPCASVANIRAAAKGAGFTKQRTDELIAEFKERQRAWRKARIKAGLGDFDREVESVEAKYFRLLGDLSRTRATSLAGLTIKLRYVARMIRESGGGHFTDAVILASTIRDLKRIAA
jgi:hypothetical protein